MELELELEDQPGWLRGLELLPRNSRIPAERFFTLLGSVDESQARQALEILTERQVELDVSALPRLTQGQATQRLEREENLARQGKLPEGLEPGDPLRRYWKEVAGLPRLTEEKAARALWENIRDPNRLTEGLLWLITEEAPGFVGHGVLLLDLMQEGAMGLMGAMEHPEAEILESARWHLRQAMAGAVALQYLVTGEAQRLLAAMRAYQQADRRLLRQLGRNPGPQELAQELGKTQEEILSLEKMVRQAAQMPKNQPPTEEEQREEPESVESSAYFQLRSRVEELLSALEDRDRRLLTLRFGLEGKPPMSQQEAAEALGITLEELQRREQEAMAFLRTQ